MRKPILLIVIFVATVGLGYIFLIIKKSVDEKFAIVDGIVESSENIGDATIQENSDSAQVTRKIEGLYLWYADLIKNRKVHKEFSPTFVKSSNGMTTLDFSNYRRELTRHDFTENLITRKIKNFQACVDNLAKIKYETFLTFTNLDQFEAIKCDFNNVHELTGDMEPHSGAQLQDVTKVDNNTLHATVNFFDLDGDKKYVWDYKVAKVTFIRQGNDWKIDELTIQRL